MKPDRVLRSVRAEPLQAMAPASGFAVSRVNVLNTTALPPSLSPFHVSYVMPRANSLDSEIRGFPGRAPCTSRYVSAPAVIGDISVSMPANSRAMVFFPLWLRIFRSFWFSSFNPHENADRLQPVSVPLSVAQDNAPEKETNGMTRKRKKDEMILIHWPDGGIMPVSYTHLTLPTIYSV